MNHCNDSTTVLCLLQLLFSLPGSIYSAGFYLTGRKAQPLLDETCEKEIRACNIKQNLLIFFLTSILVQLLLKHNILAFVLASTWKNPDVSM